MENKLKELKLIVYGLINNSPIKIDASFAMGKKKVKGITQWMAGVNNCY